MGVYKIWPRIRTQEGCGGLGGEKNPGAVREKALLAGLPAANLPCLVIFFSITEAPLPDPTPTPPNTPNRTRERTRNRPETEPKRSQNGAKRSRNGPKSSFSGWDGRGGLSGPGVGRVVREKKITLSLLESAQTLAGIASRAAGKQGRITQQRRNLPENLSSNEFPWF